MKNVKRIIVGLFICATMSSSTVANAWDGLTTTNRMYTAHTNTFYAENSQWMNKDGFWMCGTDEQPFTNAWICTNGKWYYVNISGIMVTNTWVDNYLVDDTGAWVQNITANSGNNDAQNIANNSNANTSTTNENSLVKANTGNISVNYNITNNPYTNSNIAKKENFDGTNGFKETIDGKYVYYENGKIINNCWKEFDDGIRYFDKDGYMVYDKNISNVHLNSNGTINVNSRENLSKEENRKIATGAIGDDIFTNIKRKTPIYSVAFTEKYSLDYIKYMTNLFGIQLNIQYKDVYTKDEEGSIVDIERKEGEHIYEHIVCDSLTVYVGKYSNRLNLN